MITFSGILIVIFIFLATLVIRDNYLTNRQKHNLATRYAVEYNDFLNQYKEQINNIMETVVPFANDYCSFSDLHGKLQFIKKSLPSQVIPEGYVSTCNLHRAYDDIIYFCNNADYLRKAHNKTYIYQQKLRLQQYFATCLSHPLDQQQVDSILCDDDNTLVIAGAGCGKTTTVQGKIRYLLDKKRATPKEILLLSFAKKNVDDLKERVGHLGIACKTFHSLAYHILKSSGKEPQMILPRDAENLAIDIHRRLTKDQSYLASFNDFILHGLHPIKSQNDFKTYADYIHFLKDSDFESIKDQLDKRKYLASGRSTNNRTNLIKNGEHCYIANFLFIHGIPYSYELPYPYLGEARKDERYNKHKKRYKPTFTIYLNGYDENSISTSSNPKDHTLFLDHSPISHIEGTPSFFDSAGDNSQTEVYQDLVRWRRELHDWADTKYMESYSFEFIERTIEENLIVNLQSHGVRMARKSNVEVYKILEEAYGKEIDTVLQLAITCINLFKSNDRNVEEIVAKNRLLFEQAPELIDRNNAFLAIISKVYKGYQEELTVSSRMDFNDLINQASSIMTTGTYQHCYRYIIVDEFQDISISRCKLLQMLKRQQYCKIFAVGDDWQSINRFSGSDLTLLKQFPDFFGHTVVRKIETTYRFADPLLCISSSFILKNPNQEKKTLRNPHQYKTKLLIDYSKKNKRSINQNLLGILQKLYAEYGSALANKSILLLGRYQHDINKITDTSDFLVKRTESSVQVNTILRNIVVDNNGHTTHSNQFHLKKELPFYTVHKSKGLECDIAILINCESGKYGFPAELKDDPLLSLLLTGDDDYPNGEERRAFYVAMTRAREKCYFLADKDKQSKFIRELYTDYINVTPEGHKCPHCGGELQYIKNVKGKNGLAQMFGCSNFRYGCDYLDFRRVPSTVLSNKTMNLKNNDVSY
ncbi:UvrD-helicase domain-containing protein [Sphingobacterium faecale]|uniref:DNA 3'-5' helicase n=1 Tax=Sphingobacterium faecale TaxID=2803775 RepID=A0ABS1R460_9SPHI|nr:UvrD-helicase domain-containing protein [Sphingobacterium faecale]MBL1409275.1 UvrD-helicase domain-containing protein [Sphingobacterium faecale]